MPTKPHEITTAPLGSTVVENGVIFKVWAPHADRVTVRGDWDSWSEEGQDLEAASDGIWQGFVSQAREGQQYRFLVVNGDKRLSRIDPRAREVTNSIGNGVIRAGRFDWGDDAFTTPPFNRMIIYELHAPTFGDSEASEDPALTDVEARLQHLVKLGVNAIQLMPLAEFAGDRSWGYNPAHIFAVESSYGGPDALKRLVKAAHAKGIAVILDVVYNHFGPSDLDLWQFDGWSESNLGGIYFYNDWRSETPWGNTRPDYGRGEVRQFIHDNALMWLEEFHIDGLRYDMTLYIRTVRGEDQGSDVIAEGWSLAQWVNGEIRDRFPDRILIAEDLRNKAELTGLIENGGAGFHSQWDANFVHPVREALTKRKDEWRDMQAVASAIMNKYNNDVFERVIYTESHDEVANGKARIPEDSNPDDPSGYHAQKMSCLGASLVFTAPGIPMLFQGQEFLQGGWFRDNVPVDWDQRDEFSGILRFYRDLICLRLNTTGQTKGLCGQGVHVFHQDDAAKILAFHRWSDQGAGDDVIVICNFSGTQQSSLRIGFPKTGLWRLRLNSDARIYSQDFHGTEAFDLQADPQELDHLPASAEASIGPYSTLVYSQDPS